jgi:hypothetical protein
MVVPNQQETLVGLELQLCNESDRLDPEFRGQAQVRIAETMTRLGLPQSPLQSLSLATWQSWCVASV